jgi:uncharacterized protein (DUF2141 family)
MKIIALALGLALAGPAVAQEATSDLTITFETGRPSGRIMLALFDSKTAYDANRPARAEAVPVGADGARVTLSGLAPGDYGFKAFHDLNGDGEMNTNPFGMPVEPYAFSNNAVGNMGPASWDRARFTVAGSTVQSIVIR